MTCRSYFPRCCLLPSPLPLALLLLLLLILLLLLRTDRTHARMFACVAARLKSAVRAANASAKVRRRRPKRGQPESSPAAGAPAAGAGPTGCYCASLTPLPLPQELAHCSRSHWLKSCHSLGASSDHYALRRPVNSDKCSSASSSESIPREMKLLCARLCVRRLPPARLRLCWQRNSGRPFALDCCAARSAPFLCPRPNFRRCPSIGESNRPDSTI